MLSHRRFFQARALSRYIGRPTHEGWATYV